jgi:G3E family GTPase
VAGLLFDRPARGAEVARQLSFADLLEHHEHLHDSYRSATFTANEPVNPRLLVEFLRRRPTGLYRVKGPVDFGEAGFGDRFLLNAVGGYLRFRRTPWPAGAPRRTQIVLIGHDADPEAALAELVDCLTPAEENDIFTALRHTDHDD